MERLRAVQAAGESSAAATALAELLGDLTEVLVRFSEYQLRQLPDSHDVAQDVAQETLLRVVRGAAACDADSDERFLAWAFAIARRVVVDELRASGQCHRGPGHRPDVERLDDVLLPVAWVRSTCANCGGVCDPCPESPLLTVVRTVYGALPAITADLLSLRVLGGQSWPAIAAALGTTPAGAKRRFQRAAKRVRSAILDGVAALPPQQRTAALKVLNRDQTASRRYHRRTA